jgi:hypothetical protein
MEKLSIVCPSNRTSLELLDAGLSRILFWTPNCENGGDRHRQVFYGILTLHRLAMDTALQQHHHQQQQEDNYGTAVRPNPATSMDHGSKFPIGLSPTAMRMALTVLQSLLPSILELSSQKSHENNNNSQAACARLHIERVKFALRLALLGSYWKRLMRDSQNHLKLVHVRVAEHQPRQPPPPLSIGILTEGGLFRGIRHSLPTLQQEHWEWKKRSYVGRRTGRKVTKRTMQGGDSLYSPHQQQHKIIPLAQRISSALQNNNNLHALSVMLGELLYAYRPLYWAAKEATGRASYRSWALAIFMDLLSLQLCQRTTPNNAATQAELKRRRIRLVLYLLREPMWDNVTSPSSERVGDVLDKVPLLGRLVSTYLRDWLWYMKHPYGSEEG